MSSEKTLISSLTLDTDTVMIIMFLAFIFRLHNVKDEEDAIVIVILDE